MEKEIYLYPYSAARSSYQERAGTLAGELSGQRGMCPRHRGAHRTHFDGAHLDDSMLQPLLDKWGYKRINFVLANTLQELSYDGRFSRKNHEWAKATFIPQDGTHNISLMVKSHPAVLDGFVNMVREAYKNLGLFGRSTVSRTPSKTSTTRPSVGAFTRHPEGELLVARKPALAGP